MAFSAPRVVFGIHSVSPYNRDTGLAYGELRVLESSSFTSETEIIELFGGSNKYAWAAEDGQTTAELNLSVSEYPDFLIELFLGRAPTANAAETGGSVTTLTNKYGSTVFNATTGIASVSVLSGSESDVKFGKYIVKAVSATTVDVYLLSDVDIARGTNGTVQSDGIKITASPLTITSGADTNIPNFGLKLTGGSGTINLGASPFGNTATFSARPINSKSMDVVIGSTVNTLFPEFGALCMAQKRGNQELFELDVHRCKGASLPIGFTRNEFSNSEINIKCLYDSTLDAVATIRACSPSNT